MVCDVQKGACVNCGGSTVSHNCPAEIHIEDLRAMRAGKLPPRAVRIIAYQRKSLDSSLYGPGTELKAIFESLSIGPIAGCNCQSRIDQMNIWCAACADHREQILEWLRKAYDESSIVTKIKAASNAALQGLPLTLDGLLTLAIERATSARG